MTAVIAKAPSLTGIWHRPAYKLEELLALRGSVSESTVSLEKFGDEAAIKEHVLRPCASLTFPVVNSTVSDTIKKSNTSSSNNSDSRGHSSSDTGITTNASSKTNASSENTTGATLTAVSSVSASAGGSGSVPGSSALKKASPTPSMKRGKAERLLKEHGSPPGLRVTAGGRIVPSNLPSLTSPFQFAPPKGFRPPRNHDAFQNALNVEQHTTQQQNQFHPFQQGAPGSMPGDSLQAQSLNHVAAAAANSDFAQLSGTGTNANLPMYNPMGTYGGFWSGYNYNYNFPWATPPYPHGQFANPYGYLVPMPGMVQPSSQGHNSSEESNTFVKHDAAVSGIPGVSGSNVVPIVQQKAALEAQHTKLKKEKQELDKDEIRQAQIAPLPDAEKRNIAAQRKLLILQLDSLRKDILKLQQKFDQGHQFCDPLTLRPISPSQAAAGALKKSNSSNSKSSISAASRVKSSAATTAAVTAGAAPSLPPSSLQDTTGKVWIAPSKFYSPHLSTSSHANVRKSHAIEIKHPSTLNPTSPSYEPSKVRAARQKQSTEASNIAPSGLDDTATKDSTSTSHANTSTSAFGTARNHNDNHSNYSIAAETSTPAAMRLEGPVSAYLPPAKGERTETHQARPSTMMLSGGGSNNSNCSHTESSPSTTDFFPNSAAEHSSKKYFSGSSVATGEGKSIISHARPIVISGLMGFSAPQERRNSKNFKVGAGRASTGLSKEALAGQPVDFWKGFFYCAMFRANIDASEEENDDLSPFYIAGHEEASQHYGYFLQRRAAHLSDSKRGGSTTLIKDSPEAYYCAGFCLQVLGITKLAAKTYKKLVDFVEGKAQGLKWTIEANNHTNLLVASKARDANGATINRHNLHSSVNAVSLQSENASQSRNLVAEHDDEGKRQFSPHVFADVSFEDQTLGELTHDGYAKTTAENLELQEPNQRTARTDAIRCDSDASMVPCVDQSEDPNQKHTMSGNQSNSTSVGPTSPRLEPLWESSPKRSPSKQIRNLVGRHFRSSVATDKTSSNGSLMQTGEKRGGNALGAGFRDGLRRLCN